MPIIDIGIACSGSQSPEWWSAIFGRLLREKERGIKIGQILTSASALPDSNKNSILQAHLPRYDRELYESRRRAWLTDANRNEVTYGFIDGDSHGQKADYIMWIDDDTIPPDAFITNLLATKKPFVAGLYFLARPPFNPIAYVRNKEEWGYKSIYGFPMGSMFQVDSVGMGCTLIHRDVYQSILDQFVVKRRESNGTLVPVHKSRVLETQDFLDGRKIDHIDGNWYCQRLVDTDPDDNRTFPFYAMEYIRTEDHYFCELAEEAGFKPWIDSTILCEHLKPTHITYDHYRGYAENLLRKDALEDEGSGI